MPGRLAAIPFDQVCRSWLAPGRVRRGQVNSFTEWNDPPDELRIACRLCRPRVATWARVFPTFLLRVAGRETASCETENPGWVSRGRLGRAGLI